MFCADMDFKHCDIDLWPTDPKIKMDHLWVMAIDDTNIPRKVYRCEISLKLMSGQDFANARRTDGRTDIQTDDMRHKIIQPKVASDV